MYNEVVKRLRELASIPKHCENVEDCDQCSKEDICLSFTNKRIIETTTQAADAIEELSRQHEAQRSNLVALLNERPRWIPVTERLPDQNSGNLYICLIVGGEYDQLSWYELCDFAEGQFWIRDQLYGCHVTHWMPLPPAPKEG